LARKPSFFHRLKGTIMFRNRRIDRPASRRKRASMEQLESRLNCSIDLSGIWIGTLTEPMLPQAPNWQETVTISGSGDSPSATRLSQDADAPDYFVQWSDTTSLSGNTFQLFDQSIESDTDTPLGTGSVWLQITATLTVSGNFMSGSWSSTYGDTTYYGSIQLTRQSGPPELVSVVPGGAAAVQAGQQLQGYVAEIDATSPLLPSVGLQAQIDDGDGTTSIGTIVPQVPGQVWDVYSTHTYTTPGTYTINAQVSDGQGDTTAFSLGVGVTSLLLQGQVSTTAPSSMTNPPSTVPQLPLPFPNVPPPTKAVDLTHPGAKSNRTIDQESERLANGVVKEINSLLRAGASVADFAKLTPAAKAQLIGSAIDSYNTELKHTLAAAQRDPAGVVARWLGSVVRDTVKTLSDNNAAESAGRQVVRRLLSRATGSLGASKPPRGAGHIIKPVARAGTAALEGGLEKAAIRYFASRGEKILRSQIGGSSRGIDIASYVGQGTGARLIITEAKNVSGAVSAASLTALGSGKQGVDSVNLKRLARNLTAIRRSIENRVQDPTTRQTLLDQLDPNLQTGPILRLVGNTAKGTSFNESAVQEIVRDVSGVVKFQWPPVIENLTVPK
jgi:hypothetical protein